MFSEKLRKKATALLVESRKQKRKLVTAESCTGGLIAALFTDIPGSSDVFERGFISYSYESKTEQLGVPNKVIVEQGAVSEEVATLMAQGALKHSGADIAIAVTGIAGPGGGTEQKPVGLVYIAVASAESIMVERCEFKGDRSAIRAQTVEYALEMLEDELDIAAEF